MELFDRIQQAPLFTLSQEELKAIADEIGDELPPAVKVGLKRYTYTLLDRILIWRSNEATKRAAAEIKAMDFSKYDAKKMF